MSAKRQIEIELVKLTNGDRLLRLSEAASGLCLEKKLDSHKPVVKQKDRLRKTFEAILSRELTVTS
jgi:hypothetical protein